jgi:CRP-like cAMP-binding protein
VFPAGRRIFFEGEEGDTMYLVRRGEVDLFVGENLVSTVGKGGILGEVALIDGNPRSATAIAKADCELVPVNRKQFRSIIQEYPDFAIDVMKVMAERIRSMNKKL